MKNFTKKYIISLLVIIFTGGIILFGKNNKPLQSVEWKDVPKEPKIELLLPINALKKYETTKYRVTLLVSIPANFCSVYPLEDIVNADLNEFIPKTDKSVNSWSEIITTNKYIGTSIKAFQVTEHLKKNISQASLGAKILESNNNVYDKYSESSFLMTYTHKNCKKIVFGKYYSGPYDCVGFQYTIACNENMFEEKAKQKIDDFVKKSTRVFTF